MPALRRRVLDQILAVRAPADDVLAPVHLAYAAFPEALPDEPATIDLETDGVRARWTEGHERGEVTLLGPPWTAWHLRLLASQAVMRALRGRFQLVHGAAVAAHGRAALLVGGSGCGKTTLALALRARGLGWLCDGQAPIDLETGLVRPFPRGLDVVTDASDGLACHKTGLAAPLADEAVRPGWIFFLEELFPGTKPLHLEAGCPAEATPAVVALAHELGLTRVAARTDGSLGIVTGDLGVDPAGRPAADLEAVQGRLRASGLGICYVTARMTRRPDFSRPLEVREVSQAMAFLGLQANSLSAARARETWPRLREVLAGVPALLLAGGGVDERAALVAERVRGAP